ncbi:MAG: DUF2147 domain-containing protein [Treponema sp.]|nr:DUF2147 domain-containing protein [Treponema sp.]
MKKTLALLLLLSAAAGFCFAADPAEGFWLSVDEKTGVTTAGWLIYQENGRLFGKILSMSEHPKTVLADKCKDSYPGFPVAGKVSQMTVTGTPWIYSLSQDKNGEWSGGSIVNPEDGKMYKCKIIFRPADGKKFKADTLEMRGEIGLGIGRSQFWQRSDQKTADSLGPK